MTLTGTGILVGLLGVSLVYGQGAEKPELSRKDAISSNPKPDSKDAAPAYNPTSTSVYGLLGNYVPSNVPYVPLTGKQRAQLFVNQTFLSPGSIGRAVFSASFAEEGLPPSWAEGAGGFGRRFLNRYARFTMQDAFEAAGSAALGHEVRYISARKKGFFPRTGHTVLMSFMTWDRNGRWVPAYARLGGLAASEYIGSQWMPGTVDVKKDILTGMLWQVGVGTLTNAIREFEPEIKRAFRLK